MAKVPTKKILTICHVHLPQGETSLRRYNENLRTTIPTNISPATATAVIDWAKGLIDNLVPDAEGGYQWSKLEENVLLDEIIAG